MCNRICAECVNWESGNYWFSGSGKHGVMVEVRGFCLFKKDKNGNVAKRKRWNYHPSCNDFIKRKKKGFFYEGGDGKSIQEDLENISVLMKELAEDNK